MKLVVDGNDGTGKSTLVAELRRHGYEAADRGLPTQMTDDPSRVAATDEFYLILDAPVEVCRERLRRAGKDLSERYHTIEDLDHYRKRFLEVASTLPHSAVLDATGSIEEVLGAALRILEGR